MRGDGGLGEGTSEDRDVHRLELSFEGKARRTCCGSAYRGGELEGSQ